MIGVDLMPMQALRYDEPLLDDVPVSCDGVSGASRLIAPFGQTTTSMTEILTTEAEWVSLYTPRCASTLAICPHKTLRKRGVAPDYPHKSRLVGLTGGRLVMFPNGFVLEPSDPRHPCINVAAPSLQTATFYRDVFEAVTEDNIRFVVRAECIEHVDSIFQAHFWPLMPS